MRLLFLSNLYPPYDLGGFEQWCQEISIHLRQRGHTVRVLTSQYGLERGALSEPEVSRQLYLQADVYHYRPLDFFLKRPGHDRVNAAHLRQALAEMAPELVLVWGMWNLSFNVAYWAEQWLPGRVAYFIASYWPQDVDVHRQYWELPARSPVAQWLKQAGQALALRQLRREGYPPQLRFEHVTCCSRYVRDTLVSAGKLPADASVLYGGIDPAPFLANPLSGEGAPREALRLVYFGSLLPHKGVHTAVQALGILKERGLLPQVRLTLLGGGHPDYERELHEMAAQLGVTDYVHFAGRVTREEIPARVAEHDVFLFTSVWEEPFGRTIVEAMAAGLVVIGSNVGGSREVFEHYDPSLLFPAEDASALAERIARVAGDEGLRRRLAQAGRQLVLERFTLDRMASDMEAWFNNLIGTTSPGIGR